MIRIIFLVVILLASLYSVIAKPPFIANTAEAVFLFFRARVMNFVRPKYFHNDRFDFKPIPFGQVLENTTHDTEEEGNKWTLTLHFQGEDRSTTINLLDTFDPKKPTLVYHHGAGDVRPMKDFQMVFGGEVASRYNTFIIHAAHHQSRMAGREPGADSRRASRP